jgi:hypothetical protein
MTRTDNLNLRIRYADELGGECAQETIGHYQIACTTFA